jgi:hypothetical protein
MWCDLIGNALFLLGHHHHHHHHHHVNNWKSSFQSEETITRNKKRLRPSRIRSSLPSIDQLTNARVIYSVAPSMGHNQVSFNFLKLLLLNFLLGYMKLWIRNHEVDFLNFLLGYMNFYVDTYYTSEFRLKVSIY